MADAGIDQTVARQLLAEHTGRRKDNARAVWTLIVLSEWLEWLRDGEAVMSKSEFDDPPVLRWNPAGSGFAVTHDDEEPRALAR